MTAAEHEAWHRRRLCERPLALTGGPAFPRPTSFTDRGAGGDACCSGTGSTRISRSRRSRRRHGQALRTTGSPLRPRGGVRDSAALPCGAVARKAWAWHVLVGMVGAAAAVRSRSRVQAPRHHDPVPPPSHHTWSGVPRRAATATAAREGRRHQGQGDADHWDHRGHGRTGRWRGSSRRWPARVPLDGFGDLKDFFGSTAGWVVDVCGDLPASDTILPSASADGGGELATRVASSDPCWVAG